jgi:hypothetical protein
MYLIKRAIVLALLLLVYGGVCAQQQLGNTIRLAAMRAQTTIASINSKAVFTIREGSTDFKAAIELFPIVPDKDAEDSLEQQLKPLVLYLYGQFPVDNLDFLTTADNGRMYTISVKAHVVDSIQDMPLNFSLSILRNPSITPSGNYPTYAPRLNMAFEIDPKVFGLNNPPFNMNNTVLIEITNAVINKQ